MEHVQTGNLNNDFRTCLAQLMEHGLVAHPRGTTTRELLNYNITLRNPRNRIILFPDRKTSLKYLLGELCWYLSGSPNPAGILPYAKFWDGIRNSGGYATYNTGDVNSNYGHRLFGHHEPSLCYGDNEDIGMISQWEKVQTILRADPDSRQAIMNIHLPADRHPGNKDVPCTLTLQWFIREDALHLIVNMRSNDVILGFTNDVFQFTMLQEIMAVQLREFYPNLDVGYYFHNAGSMHIYDRHFEMAGKIIKDERAVDVSMIKMDVFDEKTLLNLLGVNAVWVTEGMNPEFDFDNLEPFKQLSPYWQTLIKFCFAEDHDASHDIFGLPHDD